MYEYRSGNLSVQVPASSSFCGSMSSCLFGCLARRTADSQPSFRLLSYFSCVDFIRYTSLAGWFASPFIYTAVVLGGSTLLVFALLACIIDTARIFFNTRHSFIRRRYATLYTLFTSPNINNDASSLLLDVRGIFGLARLEDQELKPRCLLCVLGL